MPTSTNHRAKRTSAVQFAIGHKALAQIGAVEGIKLSPVMKKRIKEFARGGLSLAEHREIIKIHRMC